MQRGVHLYMQKIHLKKGISPSVYQQGKSFDHPCDGALCMPRCST